MRNNGGMGGGVLSFGRSRAKLHLKERTGVTFKDVAGVEEAKMDVMEIVEFLKNPSKFQRLGGRIPRGVLLVGSPGCGKTLLAKAIAGEADVPFYSISGSDFVEMFVGVGASRVRDLFKQAKENSPCLIFLDEIDAVGRKRGGMGGGGQEEREQTLNAILVEMDGFDSDSGIVLIAATNRPDILDPALLRPGRFDRHVVIMLPDVRGREEILKVHAKKVKISPEVDLQVLARSTPGFSGADLAALINESALLAALHDKEGVEEEDLEEARDKVRWGRQREGSFKLMDEKEKEITAYHEAGHAVIAASLDNMDPLYKVTIIPRGMALGATMQLPEKDQYHYGKKKLEGRLCIAFGGRLAEEIFCDDITTGASDDIRRATEMARKMVTEWGMSEKIGPIHYGTKERQEFLGTEVEGPRNYSELQAQRIDEEVQNILFSAQKDARHLIEEHREGLEKVARNLMKYEVLTGMEVLKLLKGESIDEERLHAQRLKEEKTRHLSEQRQVKQELEKEEEEPLPTKEKQGVKD
jgi:cell division protease FtsH